MISQAHRFHGRNALRFVYQRGQIVRGGRLVLRFVFNPKQHTYRAAVVVSRKVSKSAVVRNRIRRRIYEVVREQARSLAQPVDMVFIVHDAELADIPSATLRSLITSQLASAGIAKFISSEPTHVIVGAKETRP